MRTEQFQRPDNSMRRWSGLLLTVWSVAGIALVAWRGISYATHVGAIPDAPDAATPFLLTIPLAQIGLWWFIVAVPLLVIWMVNKR